MDYLEILKELLKQSDHTKLIKDEVYWNDLWRYHVKEYSQTYDSLNNFDALTRLISEKNYKERSQHVNCKTLGVRIRVGDICFIDFGKAYLNEAGFQHFGLILTIKNQKALVIPMTSNTKVKVVDEKRHLLHIGKIKGMNKASTLFMNDARFINTARIIDVKAHIHKDSRLFTSIYERFYETIR